jgi:hypothetical protein
MTTSQIAALDNILGQRPTSFHRANGEWNRAIAQKVAMLLIGDSAEHQRITTLHIS